MHRKSGCILLLVGLLACIFAFGLIALTLEWGYGLAEVGPFAAIALQLLFCGLYMVVTGRHAHVPTEEEYAEIYRKQSWPRRFVPLVLLLGGTGLGVAAAKLLNTSAFEMGEGLGFGTIAGLIAAAFFELHSYSSPD